MMSTTSKPARETGKAIPSTMRAAAIDKFGPPEVLKIHNLPVPKVAPKEVLIAVDNVHRLRRGGGSLFEKGETIHGGILPG